MENTMQAIQQTHWTNLTVEQQAQLKALLLEADPSWEHISTYLFDAKIFVVCNVENECIAQLCLLENHDQAEIKNLTVADSFQGQGIAKALIQHAIVYAKQRSTESIIVKTGNSSLDQLALYQKCGFRMSHIEVDVFKDYPEAIYEHGIRCLDQVVLMIQLSQAE